MLDKVLKILWLINGILMLALLSFIGYHLVSQELNSNRFDDIATESLSDDELEGKV